MRARFTTNAEGLSARMLRRARQVDPGQFRANKEIEVLLTAAGKANLAEDVYAVPVVAGGTARTKKLYNAERWVVMGRSVVHQNTEPHFRPRYRYIRSGWPPKPNYRLWRGPRYVLGKNSGRTHDIRRRHFQAALRTR
jgi:hypothetical protein